MSRVISRLAAALLGCLLVTAVVPLPSAYAAARVSIDAQGQGAVIDATYSTTLRLSGNGFQSIKGGHGGVYVWFGTVSKGWQPSKGGLSGTDYVYVPDSETKNNAGFQRFVAFPGSDTASSASAVMSASGAWSVDLTVPGPTFQAVGRDGTVRTVDCTKVTCGVITVGAHGVVNANNETFTPVKVVDLQTSSGSTTTQPSAAATSGSTVTPGADATDSTTVDSSTPGRASTGEGKQATGIAAVSGPVRLKVDRPSAVAGRAMSWTVRNLRPQRQFTLVLDDGLAASGPHTVGADGRASGVFQLPDDLRAGTHELRLFGAGRDGSVSFGLVSSDTEPVSAEVEERAGLTAAAWFALASGLVFLLVLAVVLRRSLRRRHGEA